MGDEVKRLKTTINKLIVDNTEFTQQISELTGLLQEKDFELNVVKHRLQTLEEITTVIRDCVVKFSNETTLTGLMTVCVDYFMFYYKPSSVTFYVNDSSVAVENNSNDRFSHMFEFKTRDDISVTPEEKIKPLFDVMLKSQQNTKYLSAMDISVLSEKRTKHAVVSKIQYSNKVIGFVVLEFFEDIGLADLNLITTIMEIFASSFSVLTINSILARKYDDAKMKAQFDEKTGIPNSRHFSMDIADIGDKPYCLVSLDVDDFKIVNDNHGHDSGDEVLEFVAQTVHEEMQKLGGKGYREGGDEFLGISFKSLIETEIAVRQMMDKIANKVFVDKDGNTFSITNSVGIYHRTAQEPVEVVKKKADILLYKSKEMGKKCLTTSQEVTIA